MRASAQILLPVGGGGGLNGDKTGTDLGFKKKVNRGEQWLDYSFMI